MFLYIIQHVFNSHGRKNVINNSFNFTPSTRTLFEISESGNTFLIKGDVQSLDL